MRVVNRGKILEFPSRFAGEDNRDSALLAANPGKEVKRYRVGFQNRRRLVGESSGELPVTPKLSLLSLSVSEMTQGVHEHVGIVGLTSGSTVQVAGLPPGLSLEFTDHYHIMGTPTTLGSYSVSITETLAGASNSPRVTAGLALEVVEAAAEPATAPVLTQTSAAGDNPLAWNTAFTDLIPDDADYVVMRYRENGGAWVTEAAQFVDSDWVYDYIVDGNPIPWPLYDADTFAGLVEVEVQVGVTRGTDATVWSNIISDTMADVPSQPTIAALGVSHLDYGYGASPLSTPAYAVNNGDKVFVSLWMAYNTGTAVTVTAKDAANANIPMTQIGVAGTGNRRLYLFYGDTTAAGTVTVTAQPNNSTRDAIVSVRAVRGALAGAPASSYFEVRGVTNETPHDVDGGLSASDTSILSVTVTADGNTKEHTYVGATETSDYTSPNSDRLSTAYATAAGNVTLNGQGNTPEGPSYTGLNIANAVWSAV